MTYKKLYDALAPEVHLARLLREAEAAHAAHEKDLGYHDDTWPEWYAAFILKAIAPLAEHVGTWTPLEPFGDKLPADPVSTPQKTPGSNWL